MNTTQTLMLQALKVKELNTRGFASVSGDLINNMIENSDELKVKMKNICAFITPTLFNDVEELGLLLDLSKRQIVEMALTDFLAKAYQIVEEVDVFEGQAPVQKVD